MDGCVGTRARHIGTRTILRYVISRRNGGAAKQLRIFLRAGDEKALSALSSGMAGPGIPPVRRPRSGVACLRVSQRRAGLALLGPYTDVIRILPNPLPGPLAAEDALRNLLLRGEFLDCLLAREQGRSG